MFTTPVANQSTSRLSPPPPLPLHSHVYRRPNRLSQLDSQQNLFAVTVNNNQASGNKLSVATPLLHKHDSNTKRQEDNATTITATALKDTAVIYRDNYNFDKVQNKKFSDVHELIKGVMPV